MLDMTDLENLRTICEWHGADGDWCGDLARRMQAKLEAEIDRRKAEASQPTLRTDL